MRRSGKRHYPQREKKSKGASKKKSGVSFFTLFFCPSPPGGGPPLRYSRKPLLPSCSLSSRFSFIKRSRANKRSGHGAAFRKEKTEGASKRFCRPNPQKNQCARAGANGRVAPSRKSAPKTASGRFKRYSRHSAIKRKGLRPTPPPPSGPPSPKQRATESPASIFGLKLFARFLDERLLSHIRIDQLFWARLRSVPLNRPSGLFVRCFRVLSLNARATGDEPLPRTLH